MTVLMPNAQLGVRHRIDEQTRTPHGQLLPAGWGPMFGPQQGRSNERSDGGWALGVDPSLWPVRVGDLIVSTDGGSWLVVTADLIQNNVDHRVDWVKIDAQRRTEGGTIPGGAWFVARYTDGVEPDPPPGSEGAAGLWTGTGPPPDEIPGAHVGDEYIDLSTGIVYELGETP